MKGHSYIELALLFFFFTLPSTSRCGRCSFRLLLLAVCICMYETKRQADIDSTRCSSNCFRTHMAPGKRKQGLTTSDRALFQAARRSERQAVGHTGRQASRQGGRQAGQWGGWLGLFAVIISTRSFGLATALNYSPLRSPISRSSLSSVPPQPSRPPLTTVSRPLQHRTQPIHQHQGGSSEWGRGHRQRER